MTTSRWTLPDVQKGEVVVTRFPPEASGYLHVGHAKAAIINYSIAKEYGGKLILRFDDTNPDKENPEFEKVILGDLEALGVTHDIGPTFTSDYIPEMQDAAERMIRAGSAYVDDVSKDELQRTKRDGVATPARTRTVDENLALWRDLLGGKEGLVLRAKSSIDNPNFTLRDPVLYRVKAARHPRHGDKYKAYPTYDFACPYVDSREGVTHALRTSEYNDRNAQYYWLCDAMGMRRPRILDYSRLNLEYTVMSKRKLTTLVERRVVDGWDDPRFPTVRGLLRRGLTIDGLKAFVNEGGMSRTTNLMQWSKIWSLNRDFIDPTAPRISAVSHDAIPLALENFSAAFEHLAEGGYGYFDKAGELVAVAMQVPLHPKNPELGTKTVWRSPVVMLDRADVKLLSEGDEVTLMGWGNVVIRKICDDDVTGTLNLTGDVRKTKWKLHSVAVVPRDLTGDHVKASPKSADQGIGGAPPVPAAKGGVTGVRAVVHEYDHIITMPQPPDDEGASILDIVNPHSHLTDDVLMENAAVGLLRPGMHIQIERRGFFIVDATPEEDGRVRLIETPVGNDKVCHLSARQRLIDKIGAAGNPIGSGQMAASQAKAAEARAAAKEKGKDDKGKGKGKGKDGPQCPAESPSGQIAAASPTDAAPPSADAAPAASGAAGAAGAGAAGPAADAAAGGKGKEKGKGGGDGGEKGKGGGKGKAAAPAVAEDPHSTVLFLVARILTAAPHPDPAVTALWHLSVDAGGEQPRSICAGLRAHVTAEDLTGRLVVIAANLPARKLKGVESAGMVLCACRPKVGAPPPAEGEHAAEEVLPIAPPVGAKPGDRVTVEGHTYTNAAPAVLDKKQVKHFETVAPTLRTDAAGVGFAGDARLVVGDLGPVTGLSGGVIR